MVERFSCYFMEIYRVKALYIYYSSFFQSMLKEKSLEPPVSFDLREYYPEHYLPRVINIKAITRECCGSSDDSRHLWKRSFVLKKNTFQVICEKLANNSEMFHYAQIRFKCIYPSMLVMRINVCNFFNSR